MNPFKCVRLTPKPTQHVCQIWGTARGDGEGRPLLSSDAIIAQWMGSGD